MLQYIPTIRAMLSCMLSGAFDSLRLPSTLIFFLSSTTVRVRSAHCLMLNGLIFIGSILLADYVWAPIMRVVLQISGNAGAGVSDASSMAAASIPLPPVEDGNLAAWLNVLFLYAYQLLWIYPLYAISFILNAIWYQDIADHAFITHGGVASGTPGHSAVSDKAKSGMTFQRWVSTMSDEVYRLLLVTAFMIQTTIVSFVPVVGNTLVLMHLCWMYSLYSFEYKWSLLGWSLEYRLKYFEKHWCYFLGFGSPAVALSVLFPRFLALGVYALAFPIFIILAIIANPRSHVPRKRRKSVAGAVDAHGAPVGPTSVADPSDPPVLLAQLPIFRGATWLNWWLLQKLQTRTSKTATTTTAKSTAAASKAAAGSSAAAAPIGPMR